MVTGMLATTLIPTELHLLAGCVALALPVIGGGWIAKNAGESGATLLDRAIVVMLAMARWWCPGWCCASP